MPNRAEILKQQLMQSLGLPWQELLPESRLNELLESENVSYRSSVYTPIVTLWAMVSQVLDPDNPDFSQTDKKMGSKTAKMYR